MNKIREEAFIEEWKTLYERATTLRELEPWNNFWDTELISIQFPDEEEPVYFSILGKAGSCYGIVCYRGFAGLNDYYMLQQHNALGLSVEYAMFSQSNLTCYWGNRNELSEKQRSIIKELGYKYRGSNNWLYFLSYKKSFYPYNPDKQEVVFLAKCFDKLIDALKYYEESGIPVDFEGFESFLYYYDEDKKTWSGKAEKLPFSDYKFSSLKLADMLLHNRLKKAKKINLVLEIDIVYLGARVNTEKYDRPTNPQMYLIADHNSEMVLKFQMTDTNEDAEVILADELADFILTYGAPALIIVRSIIVYASIKDICEICKIKLEQRKNLVVIDDFLNTVKRYNM